MAGDEESYTEFEDFMDKVIEFRHNGYTKDKTHKTDLNPGMCITLTSLTVLFLLLFIQLWVCVAINGTHICPYFSADDRKIME